MIMFVALMLASESIAPVALAEPDPKTMTSEQIRAFNRQLDRSHPFYIRCVKSEKIGSLVRTEVSCRTNARWRKAEDVANQEARDLADHMSSKAASGE